MSTVLPGSRSDTARLWQPMLAALLAGALQPLAFAPFGWWPVTVLGFAVLLRALRGLPTRQAVLAGWTFGLGMFGCGVWWIQVSVHQFGVPYYAFSVTVTAVFVAGMALYPALFAGLFARLPARTTGARMLALAPAAWVLLELLRAHLFTGFPWLALGYAMTDGPLAGYAPLAGVYGCSFVAAWLGGVVAVLSTRGCRARGVLFAVAAAALGTGAALGGATWTQPAGPSLSAVLVQGAVPQALKWQRDLREPTIELYRALSEPHWDADVVVWPETAIPAFPHEVPEALAGLERTALGHGTDLLVGMPYGDPREGAYFNSVMDLGETPGRYDKRHLVPFGEFFPLGETLRDLSRMLSIPLSDFSRGTGGRPALDVAGYRAGVTICYEDAFPAEVASALPEAAFLVNVSNDAWFGDTIAPHQHLQIARMRSLETGRWMLRGTNTGVTALIDDRGRIAQRSPQFAEYALRGDFVPMRGATPYTLTGDWPVAGFALLLLAAALVPARQRKAD